MVQRSVASEIQRIARERIRILFQRADEMFHQNPALSDRYVGLARRIAMRHRVRIPRELRRRFCRYCQAFLVPGINTRVRIHRKKVVVTCLRCRKQRRYQVVSRRENPSGKP
ncbi:MAG: ribonuclease P [Methanomicrobiales archaeon]|nr:ribonuclease P [Methanomicrobiales archaeon]